MNAPEGAARLFEEASSPTKLWDMLESAKLTLLSVPEERGGHGGTLSEAATLLSLASRHPTPAPVAETTLLSGWALSSSGLAVSKGVLSPAPVRAGERIELRRGEGGWRLFGRASRVPWAKDAARLVVIGRSGREALVALVDPAECGISRGENLAGDPRDEVVFDSVATEEVACAPEGVDEEGLFLRGALARSVQMAGAMEEVLDLSLRHAREREQFGRPIGRFQAIQHQLATLAGEVAAATAAVEAAVEALGLSETPSKALFEIAAAKTRAGEAAGTVAAIAHQIHGAIGFTERHSLRNTTLRLWSWREEFGAESEWASRLGSVVARRGPRELWPSITSSTST